MKLTTYSGRTIRGCKSLAAQDGHTGEPVQRHYLGGQWHLHYPARNRLAVLFRQRCELARRALAGIAHRARCDQQAAIVRGLRNG